MRTAEAQLIYDAVGAMRHAGVEATPANVAAAVNAANGKGLAANRAGLCACGCGEVLRAWTPADVTVAVKGREVVGLVMTPKHPDGSGGEVVKIIRRGPKEARQFASPVPYYEPRVDDSKRAELAAELVGLKTLIANPNTLWGERLRAEQRATVLERILSRTGTEDAVR